MTGDPWRGWMARNHSFAVIGAGSWGTTVAALAARRSPSIVWARRPAVAEAIAGEHVNRHYLPDDDLPRALRATSSLAEAVSNADVLIMATPSHGFREVLCALAPHIRPWIPVLSLTKGVEQESLMRMTEIVAEVLPGHPAGVLTGPNLAIEVLRGYAAAAVIAMPDSRVASRLQELLRTRLFRIYTSTDVAGAELGGALKNVFAIAAGMAQGLGAGDNTRATVIARSLREMTALGVAAGGHAETFAGLAGLGDLLATCMSARSRNRTVGEQLALGRSLDDIQADLGMVAEGVRTAPAVMRLSQRLGLELPIVAEVDAVIRGERTPAEAFRGLLRSTPTSELVPG
jgi:glycerol-3-phosphate dehydrogenase (NAD(P)+)